MGGDHSPNSNGGYMFNRVTISSVNGVQPCEIQAFYRVRFFCVNDVQPCEIQAFTALRLSNLYDI